MTYVEGIPGDIVGIFRAKRVKWYLQKTIIQTGYAQTKARSQISHKFEKHVERCINKEHHKSKKYG